MIAVVVWIAVVVTIVVVMTVGVVHAAGRGVMRRVGADAAAAAATWRRWRQRSGGGVAAAVVMRSVATGVVVRKRGWSRETGKRCWWSGLNWRQIRPEPHLWRGGSVHWPRRRRGHCGEKRMINILNIVNV